MPASYREICDAVDNKNFVDFLIAGGFPELAFLDVDVWEASAIPRALSAAIRCGEGDLWVLFGEIVRRGHNDLTRYIALADEYLARGLPRLHICEGIRDPMDMREWRATCCEDFDPCLTCRLHDCTLNPRFHISDWLWVRCVIRKHRIWLTSAELSEILVSPEVPMIAEWLCDARRPRDEPLLSEALRQCSRWTPRAAWVSAVLRVANC